MTDDTMVVIVHDNITSVVHIVFQSYLRYFRTYTDHAGLEIPVNSRITSLFSRQIAIGNAGPFLASECMGAKQTFRCHSVNIGLMYKQ